MSSPNVCNFIESFLFLSFSHFYNFESFQRGINSFPTPRWLHHFEKTNKLPFSSDSPSNSFYTLNINSMSASFIMITPVTSNVAIISLRLPSFVPARNNNLLPAGLNLDNCYVYVVRGENIRGEIPSKQPSTVHTIVVLAIITTEPIHTYRETWRIKGRFRWRQTRGRVLSIPCRFKDPPESAVYPIH